jgi:ribulose-phosphate 3-epimerase
MINGSSAELVHVDMMDGSFVPNISIGFPILSNLKKVCNKDLDVHYMVVHPEQYIERTAKAGAKIMTVHQEACVHLHRTISEIKTFGMMAGVALNPSTPICMLEDIINDVDMVLLMSVNPGFGGQKFIENTINKTRRLKELIEHSGSKALIEVDGGVNATTAPRLVEAGVDILVSGSYIFKSPDPIKTISDLSQL